tara:strand:+ start:1045 stop:1281 length:237 start_codon:yes stop_codon:yes gene_type:complete
MLDTMQLRECVKKANTAASAIIKSKADQRSSAYYCGFLDCILALIIEHEQKDLALKMLKSGYPGPGFKVIKKRLKLIS